VPLLDVSALRSQIKSGSLAPIYLLVGEDIKLIDRMVEAIEATIDQADRPFAVERLYAGEQDASPLDIAGAARVYPMLGDRRIVFVLRAERLLKPKRASRTAEIDVDDADADGDEAAADVAPLEEYIASPSPSTTLVFVAADVDRTRRFTKRLMERAQVVAFAGIDGGSPNSRRDGRADALALVKAELARHGRAMDAQASELLVSRSAADITKLRSDLERLLLYTEGQARISAADVDEVVSAETHVTDDWALVNAIAEGNAARALEQVVARLDRGDSPHAVLGQLRWYVSSRLAERVPGRVAPALEALLRTDLALKSSGDPRVLLERLVAELSLGN
jgi:DNA polymerase-3 subunit delta